MGMTLINPAGENFRLLPHGQPAMLADTSAPIMQPITSRALLDLPKQETLYFDDDLYIWEQWTFQTYEPPTGHVNLNTDLRITHNWTFDDGHLQAGFVDLGALLEFSHPWGIAGAFTPSTPYRRDSVELVTMYQSTVTFTP